MYAGGGQAPDASQWGQQQGYATPGYQQPAYYGGQYAGGYGQQGYEQQGYAAPQQAAYAAPQQAAYVAPQAAAYVAPQAPVSYPAPQQAASYGAGQQGYSPYPQAGYGSGVDATPAYAAPQAAAYSMPAVVPASAPPVARLESVAPVAQTPIYNPAPEASAPPALLAQPTMSSAPPALLQMPSVSSPPPLQQLATVSSPPALMQMPSVAAEPQAPMGAAAAAPAASSTPPTFASQPSGVKSQQSMTLAFGAGRGGVDTDVNYPGRLFLEVVGGRNLKNMELFGKQDPYMKLNFKAYKLRTKTHQSGGRAPVWNQTFSFELDGKDPDIAIECFDEDTTKDDFIGGANVNIQQIVNGKGSEVWVPIANKKGVNTGEVAFKAKFAQYRPAILKLKLMDAKGLPCPDTRKLDPYVIFYVDGDKANKVLAKSRVHKGGGANPTWNQDFNFKLTGREQFLDLDVWDEDVAADDHCGNARLRFVDLRQAATGPLRFPLTRPGKQSTSSIGVAVEFVPIA